MMIKWVDDVAVISGACGRCHKDDVLVELDHQLICRCCLSTEEQSLAQLVTHNQKKKLKSAQRQHEPKTRQTQSVNPDLKDTIDDQ